MSWGLGSLLHHGAEQRAVLPQAPSRGGIFLAVDAGSSRFVLHKWVLCTFIFLL
jgi:hypothetical protein